MGPVYLGFVDWEDHAKFLIQTYVKFKLFRPSQHLDKQ